MTYEESYRYWKNRYEESKGFRDHHWKCGGMREHLELCEHMKNAYEALEHMRKLIRCKDCPHWKQSMIGPNYCEIFDWRSDADDYCSFEVKE